MHRRLIYCFIICCSFPVNAHAQFGGGFYYTRGTIYYPVQNEVRLSPLNENGIKASANYWFRLKNIRLEFLPELAFTYYPVKPVQRDINEFSVTQLSLLFPINIYPLDLVSDCKCPTFSKQNTFVRKGFFIQIVPGYHRTSSQIQSSGKFFYSLGAGLGIDLGLSDLVTLSPILSYHFYPDNQFPPENAGWVEEEIQIGLRMMVRPDYKD